MSLTRKLGILACMWGDYGGAENTPPPRSTKLAMRTLRGLTRQSLLQPQLQPPPHCQRRHNPPCRGQVNTSCG